AARAVPTGSAPHPEASSPEPFGRAVVVIVLVLSRSDTVECSNPGQNMDICAAKAALTGGNEAPYKDKPVFGAPAPVRGCPFWTLSHVCHGCRKGSPVPECSSVCPYFLSARAFASASRLRRSFHES